MMGERVLARDIGGNTGLLQPPEAVVGGVDVKEFTFDTIIGDKKFRRFTDDRLNAAGTGEQRKYLIDILEECEQVVYCVCLLLFESHRNLYWMSYYYHASPQAQTTG